MLDAVMLVNTLSTEDMTALSLLWEYALANSGFTQLTLEASSILSKVIPRSSRKGIDNWFWLLSPGS